ncbi:GWxTD domain-containing protein [Fodinibius salinus]|uniref:GWxTD domain-containing protein n=1 Tax=Fodinibius salinus TaxID=860790 RepID=A0A5D3YJT8_9BACT|nr:GWxTD domain-containing protein [Fodinibius salinus]TYP92770.1 GWxTD domain-containing protein [Fodinibius salinus]
MDPLKVIYIILGGLSFIITGCAQNANTHIQRGSDYKFKAGYPEVQLATVGFMSPDNNPKINITANIVYGSLTFKEINNQQQSNISVDIVIKAQNEGNKTLNKKHYDIEIEKPISNINQSYIFEKQLQTTSGPQKIYATITDKNSGKKITREATISIPNPNNNKKNLTNIRVLGKDTDTNLSWVPITTYNIPSRIDSLLFRFQITNYSAANPLTINAQLMQIKSDNSVARPMFFSNYSSATIEYTGINYDDKNVLKKSSRKLYDKGNVFIEFRFEQLGIGNYRFKAQTQNNDQIVKARDFGVKSKNYPTLQTPRELARPLIYLMNDENYEDLLAIDNQDSLKTAIDKFWLKKIGNKVKARKVLKKYYNRVEEANKQFSNFKEGWKTDPGMVYILFGPPVFVQNTLGEMKWNYSNNVVNSRRTFIFNQPKINNESFPFDHYLLQRNQSYYSLAFQQRQLWLSGLILQRNF